ncbi:hypothetical protein [Melaminivora jejuensis]|uniref:hypothetical protein n=1 Tax=Melaminivora jejuensis TaxID=1267217 RepID=UPI001AE0BE0B|nr:hypothetical protein [Melaminivora jejuensis]
MKKLLPTQEWIRVCLENTDGQSACGSARRRQGTAARMGNGTPAPGSTTQPAQALDSGFPVFQQKLPDSQKDSCQRLLDKGLQRF